MQIKIPQVSELNRFRIDALVSDYNSASDKGDLADVLRRAMDLLREIRDAEHTWNVTAIGGGGSADFTKTAP